MFSTKKYRTIKKKKEVTILKGRGGRGGKHKPKPILGCINTNRVHRLR